MRVATGVLGFAVVVGVVGVDMMENGKQQNMSC